MRAVTLSILDSLMGLAIVPVVAVYRLRLLSFTSGGQLLSLVPGAAGVLLRRAWYRATLAACGRDISVAFGTVLHKPGSRIGDSCYFGEFSRIGLVDVGDDFMCSNNVSIMSGRRQHDFKRRDIPMRAQPSAFERVVIGEDVWIGTSATVAADVAAHSVVAAGAVVTDTFEPWSILGGVPARVLRARP